MSYLNSIVWVSTSKVDKSLKRTLSSVKIPVHVSWQLSSWERGNMQYCCVEFWGMVIKSTCSLGLSISRQHPPSSKSKQKDVVFWHVHVLLFDLIKDYKIRIIFHVKTVLYRIKLCSVNVFCKNSNVCLKIIKWIVFNVHGIFSNFLLWINIYILKLINFTLFHLHLQ